VILNHDSHVQSEEIIAYCDRRLARYKWPKQVTFCSDFPGTSLGKVRKGMLLEKDVEGA